MIKLDRKRDVLAMNLTYAEQRALEIGITIAGGADVILLDEPTAGMSKSETARFIELIREVTVGKTLLTVEHDMGVVFGLADKIAVLVYGEVIAFDTPEAVRANPRVQEAYLGSVLADAQARRRGTDMLKLDDLHAYYGKSHILHGVDIRGRRGRDRQPARAATARAARPRSRRSWAWWTARARSPGATRRSSASKAFEIAHLRHRLRAREPRHLPQAHGAPEPACSAQKRGKKKRALELRRHVRACSRA